MSQLASIIRGIASTCKSRTKKIFNSDLNIENFVTREEYEILKNLLLEIKSDVENIKKNLQNGKNT